MFVRARKAKGQLYYQLVRGYRDEAGKVRHETLGLGTSPTVAGALAVERAKLRAAKRECAKWSGVHNSEIAAKLLARCSRAVSECEARIAKLESALSSMGAS